MSSYLEQTTSHPGLWSPLGTREEQNGDTGGAECGHVNYDVRSERPMYIDYSLFFMIAIE